ncbi:MAG: antiviral reverse transcriptase Drt3a [Desulfovibrionaceae bacterium]
MLKQTFSVKTLKPLLRKKDFRVFSLPYRTDAEVDDALTEMCDRAMRNSYSILDIEKTHIRKKTVYTTSSLRDTLVIRKINDVVRRIYKVKQSDRSIIIKQIKSLLSDSTSYSIIRTDISSFYESISKKIAIKKIESDGIVTQKIIKLIRKLYGTARKDGHCGLMRGLGLSATLSEIYMRDFDAGIRRTQGVFYYARYVDDIIIFTINDPNDLLDKIPAILPDGLSLNYDKTRITHIPCKKTVKVYSDTFKCLNAGSCSSQTKLVSFLGYSITFSCHNKQQKRKNVYITISRKKINKIKTRIVRSFQEYIKTKDYDLLKQRLVFLTSNYKIESNNRKSYIMAGIYYNYPLLTEPYDCLNSLDIFLRNIIFAKTNAFWKKLRLSSSKKNVLKKYSFKVGYEKRISNNFTVEDIDTIKKCWQYE